MDDTSARVIACARTWIGTRFHHQGRLKRNQQHAGGVDCLGLLIGVARELNLLDRQGRPIADADELAYPHYPDGIKLLNTLRHYMTEIPLSALAPGCIALFRMDAMPQHLGIISDYMGSDKPELGLIHAYAQARKVVEHRLDEYWREKIVVVFKLIE